MDRITRIASCIAWSLQLPMSGGMQGPLPPLPPHGDSLILINGDDVTVV